jgi:hypothetical protein
VLALALERCVGAVAASKLSKKHRSVMNVRKKDIPFISPCVVAVRVLRCGIISSHLRWCWHRVATCVGACSATGVVVSTGDSVVRDRTSLLRIKEYRIGILTFISD